MAKLVNPVLFSNSFSVSPTAFDEAGLVEPVLNCDTKLFVDPLLLSTSGNPLMRRDGYRLLKSRFRSIIRLIDASERPGDKAWRTAADLLTLEERPETCLGYGGAGTSGSSRPDSLKQLVLATAKEIVDLGDKDPEIISMMGLFEEGVGPDTISDLCTNTILPALCSITQEFCKTHGVETQVFPKWKGALLPVNPFRKNTPILLVPRDIVRHLPLAADWSDVSRIVAEIAEIRDAFNVLIGGIAEATITDKKRALRSAALSSLDNFKKLFDALLASSDSYDPNRDTLNFYAFRKVMASDLSAFAGRIPKPVAQTGSELNRVVSDIILHFRIMVERNNLWEVLWDGLRPKRERAAQLLFFAVADAFCKANEIAIAPETNLGGGPVDFKFAQGYSKRILVEVKRSSGQVVHGYQRQLEVYKAAAQTEAAIFLVIQFGNFAKKLNSIQTIRDARLARGEAASRIEVVDARKQKSASKV